jgi:hypothetical protein
MASQELSQTMVAALMLAYGRGSNFSLRRESGGFWRPLGADREDHASTQTIEALLDRGLLWTLSTVRGRPYIVQLSQAGWERARRIDAAKESPRG